MHSPGEPIARAGEDTVVFEDDKSDKSKTARNPIEKKKEEGENTASNNIGKKKKLGEETATTNIGKTKKLESVFSREKINFPPKVVCNA